jgi:ATP-grasp domain, R2K clade family 3
MKNAKILYRDTGDWPNESDAAEKYFQCINSRMLVKSNDLIIGRYSVLPFYKEQSRDVFVAGGKLINSYQEHLYVAECQNWIADLNEFTPQTWYRLEDLPEEGPFVLKGATNSKKFWWKTHMFAKDKKEAIRVHSLLCSDSMIGEQDIVIRKYIPLTTYMTGLQGLPITKEFRFFVCYGKVLSGGYYWSSHVDEVGNPSIKEVPLKFLELAISRVKNNIPFFTIDVAESQSGEWLVIELNDGQMSGLSENNPEELYKNLNEIIYLEHGLTN